MMLDNPTDDVAGLELLNPVLTVDTDHRLLELLLRLSERIKVLCFNIHYLS
jgi:hypothetical protein